MRSIRGIIAILFAVLVLQSTALAAALKPYRVLVVASVQMRDKKVIHDAWDFGDIVALLKLWGMPFDVMRLDDHPMKNGDFLDPQGRAKYGTIIWTARSQAECPRMRQDYSVLTQAVAEHHISLIAVGNKMQDGAVASLLGLKYERFAKIAEPLVVVPSAHFITRTLGGVSVPAPVAFAEGGPIVRIGPDVATLARAGNWPQLTTRTIDPFSLTRAVWIGGDPDSVFRNSPVFINLLKRSLIWTQGAAVLKDYDRCVLLRMDDPGSSQSAYFTGWDYPQLDRKAIESSLISPLRSHGAQLGVFFCPGYPWIPERKLRHSVTIDFVDPRGVRQNMVSEAIGLTEGAADGVIEVESHGLTHMPPDLSSKPKDGVSWWNGSLKREWPEEGWYREFYDMRRDREVSAADQLRHMRQSADWIEEDFGLRPLVFVAGGHAISGDRFVTDKNGSHIADNYTYKLAAEAGFGLALDTGVHYLGRDWVISLGMCPGQNQESCFARGVPAVIYFHDRDVYQDPDYLKNLLERLGPSVHYMSPDELVAYLHTDVNLTGDPSSPKVTITPDSRYCRYFVSHESTWTLYLADGTTRRVAGRRGGF